MPECKEGNVLGAQATYDDGGYCLVSEPRRKTKREGCVNEQLVNMKDTETQQGL